MTQYKWYFSDEDVDNLAVYIPRQEVIDKGLNVIEILKKKSPEEIKAKQDAIEKIAPRLQYSIVPEGYGGLGSPGSRGSVWGPPTPDAADVIIEKILSRETVEPLTGFSDEELEMQKQQQKQIMATHPDYIGLMPKEKEKGENKRKPMPKGGPGSVGGKGGGKMKPNPKQRLK